MLGGAGLAVRGFFLCDRRKLDGPQMGKMGRSGRNQDLCRAARG